MIRLLCLSLLACFYFSTYAQVRSSTDAHKWEVGLDMRPFLDTSLHLRESVLFKYRPNDQYKYRLRLGFSMNKYERHFPFEPKTDTLWLTQPTLYVALGAERRVFSSRKVYIGLGADAFLFYGFRNEDYHFDNSPFGSPDTEIRRVIRDRDLRTGLNLLLNCEYLIIERLSVGVEAFWQLAYRHLQLSAETKVGPPPLEITRSGVLQNRFSSHVQPFSALNILFKF